MESDKIETLLEKYFEATSTVAEEESLRTYFSGHAIAPHLEQYAPMFQYFSKAKEERFTKKVPTPKPIWHKQAIYRWISVAAVAVLLFGVYFGREYQERKDAEYAYAETKKALDLLAQNFSKGTEKVAYLKQFEKTKQKIYNEN
ncbi:MAG: hypothetical protein E4H26_00755 [Flavobacteriales bacterium]|nr:MAG: hypothetical protein E4H26_00755 [Flavobacteriales bacterium]